MTLLADKDDRFKNLFGKAALFVLLAVLGMGLVFFWTGMKKGAFTPKSPIYFVADTGLDLKEGIPVKFSGFKIGKLTSLALDEQGHVQVEIEIETKHLVLLRQDSVVSLKKEGVIGDGVLDISRGSEDKPVLVGGSKVLFERANGLEQAVMEVKGRVMPIIDDVHKILSDPDGDVRQTLKNVRQLTAEINGLASEMRGTRQKIDQVLVSVDKNLNNEVGPLLHSLRQSAVQAETITTKLNQDLPGLLNKVDSSMENLRKTTETINKSVQQTVPQLPGMVGETRETMGKTREMMGSTIEVVNGLSTMWPLKGSVPVPEKGPVRMDSHD
ncbi:MAG: MlaD family protein [Gallionellaceae bacterium]|nr:MlaD family protein [Gallionellaceae bacterium]